MNVKGRDHFSDTSLDRGYMELVHCYSTLLKVRTGLGATLLFYIYSLCDLYIIMCVAYVVFSSCTAHITVINLCYMYCL